MGERLFTPKSLARVAEAVEWEDELIVYPDGSNNQERYMKAMAILWERWMRGWSIPDFASSFLAAGNLTLATRFSEILDTMAERIAQLKGFYEGLWAGANPETIAPSRFLGPPDLGPMTAEEMTKNAFDTFFEEMTRLFGQSREERGAS